MNKCCCCGSDATVGIDFIPYYDYIQGYVPDKFVQLNRFCDVHFLLSYHAFYISTTVGWEINYSFSDNKEVREIVANSYSKLYSEASDRHSDDVCTSGNDTRTRIHSVHNAWNDARGSDTKTWRRKKGGKA